MLLRREIGKPHTVLICDRMIHTRQIRLSYHIDFSLSSSVEICDVREKRKERRHTSLSSSALWPTFTGQALRATFFFYAFLDNIYYYGIHIYNGITCKS